MTIIRRARRKDNFTVLSNDVLRDSRISYKAAGVLCTLLSYPDNWQVNVKHLAGLRKDGQTAVKAALKELKQAGYIKKVRVTNSEGKVIRWESMIFDEPQDWEDTKHENQRVENPPSGLSTSGKPTCLINTYSNKDQEKEELSEEPEPEAKPEAIAEKHTHTQRYAPEQPEAFPHESEILEVWQKRKAEKWRAYTPGTLNPDTFYGIAFFVEAAGGDKEKAIAYIDLSLEEATKDDWLVTRNVSLNQFLNKSYKRFLGQYLASALDRKSTSAAAAAPAAAPKFTSLF